MRKVLTATLLLSVSSVVMAQTLSPQVRDFVKVDAPVVALTHVRVIDGTGAGAPEDQTVMIFKGKISAVGNAASVSVPSAAKVLDLHGYSVIPGLVGMHDHMFYPMGDVIFGEMGFSFPRLYLAGGVTTIRTTGSLEPYTDLEIKKKIDAGRMPGPKIHVTGPYLEGAGSWALQLHQLTGPEDATKTVNYWLDEGVDNFKAYMFITPAELAAAVTAAHKRGAKVTGHLCSIGFREAASLGIDNLEHGLVVDTEFFPSKKPGECPDEPKDAELISQLDVAAGAVHDMIVDLIQHHVAVTSTLPVFEMGSFAGRPTVQKRVLDALSPDARGVIAGFGDQREVELLVEAGFTPVEAIHIATANGAQFLGELDRIGTIAVGKQADLVVIKGDPSQKIDDIENVETVFKDGIGYDSAQLIESVRGVVGSR